ncbi:MAG TPA: OadG family protein [Candidatus Limivicinus faecipullorum]|nr:OadG family protein [Candidatus Limivicinus faecipullorum]
MDDLVNISIADAGIVTLLGYAVVFIGLILLMAMMMIMGAIMVSRAKKAAAAAPAAAAVPAAPAAPKAPAPGSAGELKLYDTDPRDAAMVMAIVADTLGKPLNELRFKSIKEVKEDEV